MCVFRYNRLTPLSTATVPTASTTSQPVQYLREGRVWHAAAYTTGTIATPYMCIAGFGEGGMYSERYVFVVS